MGWILSPVSKRQIAAANAASMISTIRKIQPGTKHVAVFAGQSIDSIIADLQEIESTNSSVDYVQITEDAPYIQALRQKLNARPNQPQTMRPPVIPVLRPTSQITDADFLPTSPSDFWILDTFDPVAKGGTGRTINASLFAPVSHRFLVAGGITPSNAKQILTASGAFGVDVSSGVESDVGYKNKEKLALLFTALQRQI